MASVVVQVGFNKKETVKLTPMQPISFIVEEVCGRSKGRIDPSQCKLKHGKKVLDLTLPWRFANLPTGCKLELECPEPALAHQAVPASPAQTPAPAPAPAPALASSVHPPPAAAPPEDVSPAHPPRPAPTPTPAPGPAAIATPDLNTLESVDVAPEPMGIKIVWPETTAKAPPKLPAEEDPAKAATTADAPAPPVLSEVETQLGRRVRVTTLTPKAETEPEPSAEGDVEMDDSFYEFTAEDFARVEQSRKRAKERFESERVLKTVALREREAHEATTRAAQSFATIRVRFSDRTELESEFQALEPVSALHALLARCAASQPAPAVHVFTTPPKQMLPATDTTFFAAGLTPATLVHCDAAGGTFLRAEVLALAAGSAACSGTLYAERVQREAAAGAKGTAAGASGEDTKASKAPVVGAGASGQAKAQQGKPGVPKWLKL